MKPRQNILLTVTPFLDYAGSIPREYVSRHLAKQLIEEGYSVHLLVDSSQSQNWPETAEIVTGDIRRHKGLH